MDNAQIGYCRVEKTGKIKKSTTYLGACVIDFKIKNFPKKPASGGIPAKENNKIVKKRVWLLETLLYIFRLFIVVTATPFLSIFKINTKTPIFIIIYKTIFSNICIREKIRT